MAHSSCLVVLAYCFTNHGDAVLIGEEKFINPSHHRTKTKMEQVRIAHAHRTIIEGLELAKKLMTAISLRVSRKSLVTLQRHYSHLLVVRSSLSSGRNIDM